MPNKTASRECRFLSEKDLDLLHRTFNEAFSDYVLPLQLSATQFNHHLELNAVDITRSVGCFERGEMIGCSLNGFGKWNGRSTVYDAGTGVIPAKRRQGVSNAMFELMLPVFRKSGVEQFLLEVITSNTTALGLYENLGFEIVRELALLRWDRLPATQDSSPNDFMIKDLTAPDWRRFETFWDAKPSWQNMPDALTRVIETRCIAGAFAGDECLGYIIFSKTLGRVSQLAVDKAHRNRGVATALLHFALAKRKSELPMQIVNLDKSLKGAIRFLKNRGFSELVSQYEMLKRLQP